MSRKILNLGIFAILLVMLTTAAFAQSSVSIQDETNSIFSDQRALYIATIDNHGTGQARYQVYSVDPRFITTTDPSDIIIERNSSRSVSLYITPAASFSDVGTFSVPIIITDVYTREEIAKSVDLIVKSDAYRQIAPSLIVDIRVNGDQAVDPREPFGISFRIVNTNRLNISNLSVSYSSGLCSGQFSSELPPNGELRRTAECIVNPYTEPQTDVLRVDIFANGKRVNVVNTFSYDVGELPAPFEVVKGGERFFLKNTLFMNVTNPANAMREQVFIVERNTFEKAFSKISTSNNVKSATVDDGYEFTVRLAPGEAATIYVETNTRGFFVTSLVVIAIVIVIVILYFMLRSPIVLTRKVTVLPHREGQTTQAKILLSIQNRTGRVLDKIKVVETIPSIADVDRAFDVGTLKPTKIVRHERKGTLVRWDFTQLEPFEERVITYRITSRLSIIGRVHLPPTSVKFSMDGGKTFRSERFIGSETKGKRKDDE